MRQTVLTIFIVFSLFLLATGGDDDTAQPSTKTPDGEAPKSSPTPSAGATTSSAKPPDAPPITPSTPTNCTVNGTDTCKQDKNSVQKMMGYVEENKEMLKRAFYVLLGVTAIVILYFVVRTVRLRRRKSKSKRYGIISQSGDDNLEMRPLDQEDDDEDMTVFEINHK